jgi:hypothetical protein
VLLGFAYTLVLAIAVAWGSAALWFDGPAARWLAGALAAGFGALCLGALFSVRPYRRALLAVTVVCAIVVGWWLSIPPRTDRDWMPDVARSPTATIEGNRVTVHNVRNFDYRSETDYTERWETRSFDLDQLLGVDLFLCFWGPSEIAHTIVSWEFADGSHLAVSIETRKERGESYSAVRGFFRQFEVYYVVADERDVVRLRTDYRGERVFLYRLRTPPEEARALLLDYLREINELAQRPRWYNALTHNCTTAIRYHARQVGLARPLDWRLFANGHLDELGYERGMLDTSLPLEELRRRSDITDRATAVGLEPHFSARIREGLPGKR